MNLARENWALFDYFYHKLTLIRLILFSFSAFALLSINNNIGQWFYWQITTNLNTGSSVLPSKSSTS